MVSPRGYYGRAHGSQRNLSPRHTFSEQVFSSRHGSRLVTLLSSARAASLRPDEESVLDEFQSSATHAHEQAAAAVAAA